LRKPEIILNLELHLLISFEPRLIQVQSACRIKVARACSILTARALSKKYSWTSIKI